MTQAEKINYMRISTSILGFAINYDDLDLLVNMYELVMTKKGKTSLDDTVEVKLRLDARKQDRLKEKLLKEEKLKQEVKKEI